MTVLTRKMALKEAHDHLDNALANMFFIPLDDKTGVDYAYIHMLKVIKNGVYEEWLNISEEKCQ